MASKRPTWKDSDAPDAKGKFKNLLQDKLIFVNKRLELKPFQTVWISN